LDLSYILQVIGGEVAFRTVPEGPRGLRDRKRARTGLAIEEAALELFERQGFDATSVDQIAERAEVSRTTFFRYFPTKADVVLSNNAERLPSGPRVRVT
jgi:transcriptional regulator GlxA family with amidase domain